jgi:ATP-dependent Clp protease, protease subunit
MTLRLLPEIKALERPRGYSWDVPSDAFARWVETPQAAAEDGATITIYDVIGEDWSGSGFTAKRMNAALRSIGARDVTVKVNSPGGDTFEGFAIYNELRQHRAKVSVQVMGIAASAAAYIAMAGDEIAMGLGSFMMVHNSWGLVMGNRNDLADAIGTLEAIDGAQMDIFEARTGLARKQIEKFMDAETFFSAAEAVKNGFADTVMDVDAGAVSARAAMPDDIIARRRLEAVLARQGIGRKERADLLNTISGPRDATGNAARDAGEIAADLGQLLATLRS